MILVSAIGEVVLAVDARNSDRIDGNNILPEKVAAIDVSQALAADRVLGDSLRGVVVAMYWCSRAWRKSELRQEMS